MERTSNQPTFLDSLTSNLSGRRTAEFFGKCDKLIPLSDPMLKEMLCDRISFRRFVGLTMDDMPPRTSQCFLYEKQVTLMCRACCMGIAKIIVYILYGTDELPIYDSKERLIGTKNIGKTVLFKTISILRNRRK